MTRPLPQARVIELLDEASGLARDKHQFEKAHAFEQAASDLQKYVKLQAMLQDALQGKTA